MDKKMLVAGCGVSGIGAAKMLIKNGEQVILYDGNKDLDAEALKEKVRGADVVLGDLTDETTAMVKTCIISPGISLAAPFVQKLVRAGIPVLGEIEAAYRCSKGRLAAVTGTNGKTTTTALVGQIFKNYYGESFVVGNIGTAYTDMALLTTDDSVTVAEVSSFQLETIDTFHPQVSAILNITPDHMDRHGSMEEYIRVKELITKNQKEDDFCVLNNEDEALKAFGETLHLNVIWFSSKRKINGGIYLENDSIVSELSGKRTVLAGTDELNILGVHNYENAMAAAAVAWAMGVPEDVTAKTLKEFRAVEHRIEFVTEKDGIAYYNDSKGTNPDAAIKGVCAMDRPVVLIAGGYDKGASYDEWLKACRGRVKKFILMGETADKIARAADRVGAGDYCFAATMKEAVEEARASAVSGDAILLSPACASWDMFKNYEERGRIFKACARGEY